MAFSTSLMESTIFLNSDISRENAERAQKREIQIAAYRWVTPTYVHDLAKAIVELSLADQKGIFHVTGLNLLIPMMSSTVNIQNDLRSFRSSNLL